VAADAFDRDCAEFGDEPTALGLVYAVRVSKATPVWRPGEGPPTPEPTKARGRPSKHMRRTKEQQPPTALDLEREILSARNLSIQPVLLQTLTDRLKQRLAQESDSPWKVQYVTSCMVVSALELGKFLPGVQVVRVPAAAHP